MSRFDHGEGPPKDVKYKTVVSSIVRNGAENLGGGEVFLRSEFGLGQAERKWCELAGEYAEASVPTLQRFAQEEGCRAKN